MKANIYSFFHRKFVQNVRSPPGIYIVTTVPDARVLVLLEDSGGHLFNE